MSESRELRRIAKLMQDMRIEASCLFNAADRIDKMEAAQPQSCAKSWAASLSASNKTTSTVAGR